MRKIFVDKQAELSKRTESLQTPGGYFQMRRSGGGLGPHIKFGGKTWGKGRPSSQNRRKNLGGSVTKRRKSWEKVPILGSYLKFRRQNLGYLSFIFLEAKFGAPTRISEAKFGAKPPRPPNMEVPPWVTNRQQSDTRSSRNNNQSTEYNGGWILNQNEPNTNGTRDAQENTEEINTSRTQDTQGNMEEINTSTQDNVNNLNIEEEFYKILKEKWDGYYEKYKDMNV